MPTYTYDDILTGMDKAIAEIKSAHRKYDLAANMISILNIVLSSSIPILITLAENNVHILLLVSIFSALITLLQTLKSTFHLEKRLQGATVALAELKAERMLFASHTRPYTHDDEENIHIIMEKFAQQTENLSNIFEDKK